MDKLTKALCRVCCENPGQYLIFEEYDESSISAKLFHCCPLLNIKKSDEFSQYICTSCEEELCITHSFILKCESADEKLRSLSIQNIKYEYESDFIVKEENIESDEVVSEAISPQFQDRPDYIGDNSIRDYKCFKKTSKSKVKKKCLKKSLLKCKVCERQCLSQSNFIIHMRSHTNERPFACQHCEKTYKDPGGLKRHVDRSHSENMERNIICDYCGKGFYSKNLLKAHVRIHTGETPYSCTFCHKAFNQPGSKFLHEKSHKGEKTHKCPICDKLFITRHALKKHSKVHSTEKNYSCIICNTRFKFKESLTTHMKVHTDQNKFICDICGGHFTTKGNLTVHMKRKHSNTAGHCSICGKHVSNIQNHMYTHTGERPLACEECPKRFLTKQALSHHLNFKHKLSDRFKCVLDNCKSAFPTKAMLDYHITKEHNKLKAYSCEKCPRKFYRKSDLTKHTTGTHKSLKIVV